MLVQSVGLVSQPASRPASLASVFFVKSSRSSAGLERTSCVVVVVRVSGIFSLFVALVAAAAAAAVAAASLRLAFASRFASPNGVKVRGGEASQKLQLSLTQLSSTFRSLASRAQKE